MWRLNGIGYQNTLITDIYNFMNYITSLSHDRGNVVQEKSLVGQCSGTSSPGAGLWVTSSSLGAGKITPYPGAGSWGALKVSQILSPFWLPSELSLLASPQSLPQNLYSSPTLAFGIGQRFGDRSVAVF